MTVAAIVVLGALIAGVAGNFFFFDAITRYNQNRKIGQFMTSVSNINASSVSLLTLLLAFVLFAASTSYSRARVATQTEAAAVDNFFETANYLRDPFRRRLQRSATCYARAVAGPEWEEMGTGNGKASNVPGNWTGDGHNGIRKVFAEIGPENPLFAALTAADQKRGDARRDRLTESKPKVPAAVLGFILASIVVLLLFYAVLSPRLSPFHIVAVSITALTLLAAVLVIRALDRPFSGPLRIAPTEIQTTAGQLTDDFIESYGAIRLRCDADGRPTESRTR